MSKKKPELPMLMTTQDIADAMAISVRTVFRMIADGRFPPADWAPNRKLRRWKRETVRAVIERMAGPRPDNINYEDEE